MRIGLSTFLLIVFATAIALGLSFRKRSNDEILRDIYSVAPAMQFESDISSLNPYLSKLDAPPPRELLNYLEHWVPVTEYYFDTGLAHFPKLSIMMRGLENSVPDIAILEFGFFPIADEGTGWKFAYCVHDQRIYLLGYLNPGDVFSTDDVIQEAYQTWPNLTDFLLETEKSVDEINR